MSFYASLVQLFEDGGFVLIPLSLLTFLLCYALTFRFLRLNFSADLASARKPISSQKNSLVKQADEIVSQVLKDRTHNYELELVWRA